jgi:hypothetical protein
MNPKLTYKNKTYDLVLFDSFYVTTKQPYAKKHYADLETIINTMQEHSNERFDYVYQLTYEGKDIKPSQVHQLLLDMQH